MSLDEDFYGSGRTFRPTEINVNIYLVNGRKRSCRKACLSVSQSVGGGRGSHVIISHDELEITVQDTPDMGPQGPCWHQLPLGSGSPRPRAC